MIDFIKKLEKEFDIEIIHSREPAQGENTFDLHENGSIKSLHLYKVNLKKLGDPIPDHVKVQFETDHWVPKGL